MHNYCLMICETKSGMLYYEIYLSATKVVFEGIQLAFDLLNIDYVWISLTRTFSIVQLLEMA
jgi:hypothetical protein